MEIRKANKNDDFNKIAELIYATDDYIYPFWFKGYKDWKKVLVDIIKSKDAAYSYENIIVAVDENKTIAGILIYLLPEKQYTYDYSALQSINENFKYAIDKYVKKITRLENNTLHISNVCVDPKYRGQHISSKLLYKLKELCPNHTYDLDVVADNNIAIKLYQKEGFEITKKYKGFNGPRKRKPYIYNMKYYNK